ncbi:MAG: hypothetical protein EOM40_02840 [Clostridia bacterium]|nr:hypothetical protein [Clostridia bacterium]NCC42534.1 hypothetical protein [Clostridia bacterium]
MSSEHEYLTLSQNLMESSYTAIQMQIHQMEENQKLIDTQMKKLTLDGEAIYDSEKITSYLQNLEEEYQMIQQGFSCGIVDEKDMMKLLIKLFDYGIGEDRILEKNKTITLHATWIHNQIVIEYSYDMEERKESTAKQKKR